LSQEPHWDFVSKAVHRLMLDLCLSVFVLWRSWRGWRWSE